MYKINIKVKDDVTQQLVVCDTHSTLSGCRGADFNVYLAYTMTCGGQLRRSSMLSHLIKERPILEC